MKIGVSIEKKAHRAFDFSKNRSENNGHPPLMSPKNRLILPSQQKEAFVSPSSTTTCSWILKAKRRTRDNTRKMPPKKQKVSDSVDANDDTKPKRKLTKKQLREQAMARAKASMEADKAKVKAVKKGKMTASQKKAAEPEEEEQQPTPAKKRRKVEKTTSSKHTPSASSKKKAREEAIQRAKEWAAQDKEELEKKKSPEAKKTRTVGKTAAPKAAGASPQIQPRPPPQGMVGSPPKAAYTGQMNPAMIHQYMQGMGYGANPYMMQQQPYAGGFPGPAQFAGAYGSPNYMGMAQQQVHPAPVPPAAPPVAASAAKKSFRKRTPANVAAPPKASAPDKDDDDDDMPLPPATTLEMQISQQVLANVSAHVRNLPEPHTAPPPAAFQGAHADDDEEEEIIDEEPIVMDAEEEDFSSTATRKKSIWGKGLLGAIIVGVLSYFLMVDEGSLHSPLTQPQMEMVNLVDPPPCFENTKPVYESETGEILSACNAGGAPCPDWGVCEGGELVQCRSKFHQVSANKAGCILSTQTNQTIDTITDLLEAWTEEELCSLDTFEKYPMFAYSKVQLASPNEVAVNTLTQSILETAFVTERRGDGLHLGLAYDLELPFLCRMSSTFKLALAAIGSLFIVAFHSLLSFLLSLGWNTVSTYPLISLIGLVVVVIVKRIRNYRAYRSKLVCDIAQARQMAYEFLQNYNTQSHVVLHIRDEIAMNLYPYSNAKRQYLIHDVWPRLIPDLKADNRIRKSTKVMEGKPRDVWQWVAVASTKKEVHIQ